jgi:hypothetical protein
MHFQDIKNLKLEGFSGAPAWVESGDPALVLEQVDGANIVDSTTAAGTKVFLKVKGAKSQDINVHGNEIHMAHAAVQTDKDVKPGSVKESDNY